MTSQVLIGVPNTIEEEIIKQTMDKELKHIKQILLLTNKDYKLTREQSNNWMRYAVMNESQQGCHGKGLRNRNKSREQATQGLPTDCTCTGRITKR